MKPQHGQNVAFSLIYDRISFIIPVYNLLPKSTNFTSNQDRLICSPFDEV